MWVIRILFVCLFWVCTYFWGDWKNWRKFESTILFLIAGNFLVFLLTYNYVLWDVSTTRLNRTINEFLITLFVFPAAMVIYLKDFPERKSRQLLRILLWTFLFSAVEYVELLVGNIHYQHGWNIGWSMSLNFFLFLLAFVHRTNPIAAFSVFGLLVLLFCLIFHVPLSEIK